MPASDGERNARGARAKAQQQELTAGGIHPAPNALKRAGLPQRIVNTAWQLVHAAVLHDEGVASSDSLSAASALISSLAPKNEAEAALAIHIACLHTVSMRVLARSNHCSERLVVAMGSVAAKLERAFQTALETYYRLRRGVTQIVRVERVEVQAGAQAIVGVVKPK